MEKGSEDSIQDLSSPQHNQHDSNHKPETFGNLDSGVSWIMAICGFSVTFMTFGTVSIFGVYLAHYSTYEFKNEPRSILQLVGGLGPAIFALCCLPAGILSGKIGNRFTIIVAGLVYGCGLVIASFATQVWHLFIGQSILIGVATSFCFIPIISIIPQWFNKYRGIAMGISASGSGIGGLVLAPMIQAIIDSIGIRWALRVNAIVGTVVLVSCGFILRPRMITQPQKKLIDLDIILDRKFLSLWTMGMFAGFGYWTPFFMMPLYCKHYDIAPTTASIIVGLMNGGSAFGRIAMGQASNFLGNINTLFMCHFIVALSFLIIWHFATVTWSLVVFSIIFGLFSGAFYTLAGLIAPQLYGVEKLARVNGPFYMSLAPGYLAGTMISQAIVTMYTTNNGAHVNYLPMQLYLFVSYILSCVFILILRAQLTKKVFIKV